MSTPETVELPPLDDDGVLEHTQRLRYQLTKEMTAAGMPTDKGDKVVLLQALTDMDRQALTKKKLGADEKKGVEDRRVALMISQLGTRFGSQSPFEAGQPALTLADPVLNPAGLEPLTIVPGEVAQGIEMETCESFIQRMENGGGILMEPPSKDE